jgi:hypothetical protein
MPLELKYNKGVPYAIHVLTEDETEVLHTEEFADGDKDSALARLVAAGLCAKEEAFGYPEPPAES